MTEPLWLQIARIEIGTKEIPGPENSKAIQQYWEDAGLPDVSMGKDEVPWCAAFANAMLARSGYDGTGKANALSFATWGKPLITPVKGCVCVFKSPTSSWQGHVAFYIGTDKINRRVHVLGGNQGDAVSISSFSIDRLVKYRWPTGAPISHDWVGPFNMDGSPIQEVSDR